MKKTTLLTVTIWMIFGATFAQRNIENKTHGSDSIDVISNFYGTRFYYKNQPIKAKDFKVLLQPNAEAYNSYKSARTSNAFSTILSYAGGFLIGWPIGTAIGGGKPEWALAGIGGGLVALAIPLAISSNKKMKKAVHLYNSGI